MTSQCFGSPSIVISVYWREHQNINSVLQNQDFLKGKLHLFYLFQSKPWNLVRYLLTIYNESWRLGVVPAAAFHVPWVTWWDGSEDCCHSEGPVGENCAGVTCRKALSPLSCSFSWCFISNSEYFYKTSCYYSQIETCLIYSRFLCKKCHRTLSRQADCNSRLRSVTCNSTRGEEFLPVPLTWISNIKWNGCSIPLGKTKTKLFNRWIFFSPHLSFLQSTYFSPFLVCQCTAECFSS